MKYIFYTMVNFLFITALNAQLVGGIAILVKEDIITLNEIEVVMNREHLSAKDASELLIRETLEASEIKKRQVSVSDDDVYKQIELMAKQNRMSVSQLYEAMLNARKLTQKELKEKIRESKLKEKLYNAIAFSTIDQPTDEDELEYYNLHKERYTLHNKYDITIYSAQNRNSLESKISNPMLNLRDVRSKSELLKAQDVDPRLGELLENTKMGTFSRIVPSPNGGFMSFYINEKIGKKVEPLDVVRMDVKNSIMQDARGQVLNDYFTRLRLNSEIKILRLPQ